MSNEDSAAVKRSYGWIPDLPDQRDIVFTISKDMSGPLPSSVDLRSKCPPVYDQGQLGSCTGNAIGGAFEFVQMKEGVSPVTPSRLFIYWNERYIENTVKSDSGAQIRDGIKVIAKLGAPPETDWPYVISKFTKKPSAKAFKNALQHTVTSYQSIPQDLNHLKTCLASGLPFVFGFTVYSSFESQQVAQTGIVPMPHSGERALGGHAVMAVGYNDTTQRFIVRNSWGTGWGQSGYCEMPYAYLTNPNLASDFWSIQVVKQ